MRSIKEINHDINEILPKRFKGADTNDIEQRFSELCSELEVAKNGANQEDKAKTENTVDNVVYLPNWLDEVRGVPNGLLRSALFGVIKRGVRRYLDGEQIAAVEGVEIYYTGQQLDQGDQDTWQSVLHFARLQALGNECRVTSYQLLKLMGLTDTGKNRKILEKRITRLRANAVKVKQGKYVYIGGLIHEAFKDEITQEWVIVINPRLSALFSQDQYTLLDWQTRQSLTGKQLAQWLYSYYASHAKPYPIKIASIHRLCGSEARLISEFKKDLIKALNAVGEVYKAMDTAFKWEIKGDLLHVDKPPSDSQKRHLLKDSKKKPR